MNTSPESKPIRVGTCGWCLIAACVAPWVLVPLLVWGFLTYGA
jgi:hypothetical protein